MLKNVIKVVLFLLFAAIFLWYGITYPAPKFSPISGMPQMPPTPSLTSTPT